MQTVRKYPRASLAVAASVVLFLWCIAAARSDNRRWLADLHSGHRSAKFTAALAQLRQSGAGGVDECSVCHGERSWAVNLVSPMAPVATERCTQCHQADASAESKPDGTGTAGVRWVGVRAARPAHRGTDFGGDRRVVGLPLPGGRPLACADCHGDHQGEKLADAPVLSGKAAHSQAADPVAIERETTDTGVVERKRYRLTQACLNCHLPRTPSPTATRVLKEFAKWHQGGNGFESPEMAEEPVKAVEAAAADQPLAAAAQNAFVDAALAALTQQSIRSEKRRWKEPSLRGCTPGCHGEHVLGLDDATPEKYR